MKLFVPASLIVVVFDVALVIENDAWTFDYRRRADRDGADPGGRDRLHPGQPARDRRAAASRGPHVGLGASHPPPPGAA